MAHMNYRRNRPGDDFIFKMSFSEEEYEAIVQAAKENNMPLAAYVREMILKGYIAEVDMAPVNKVINDLNASYQDLSNLLLFLHSKGDCNPDDLAKIQKLRDDFRDGAESMNKAALELLDEVNRSHNR